MTWRSITPQKMKKFIGMLLYMAFHNLPKMSDFWRSTDIFKMAFTATVMSRDRLLAIIGNSHMSDPADDVLNEQKKKGVEHYDPLQKVRLLLTTFYHPHQHISADERMVTTEARIFIKQYVGQAHQMVAQAFCSGRMQSGLLAPYRKITGCLTKDVDFDVVTSLVKWNSL
ncbi:uncharacterized protein V6R79_004236 [Siganus canaliculatus]